MQDFTAQLERERENIGREKYYHESGEIWRVKVLDVREKEFGKSKGLEYDLESLQNAERGPAMGDKFSVWRAYDAGAYAGWFLLDH